MTLSANPHVSRAKAIGLVLAVVAATLVAVATQPRNAIAGPEDVTGSCITEGVYDLCLNFSVGTVTPNGTDHYDLSLAEAWADIIETSDSGSSLYVSMFEFSNGSKSGGIVIDAIEDRLENDADHFDEVNILVDDTIVSALSTLESTYSSVDVLECDGTACLPYAASTWAGANHPKLVVLLQPTSDDVYSVGSQNFNNPSARRWNDTIIVTDSAGTQSTYLYDYFYRMWHESWQGTGGVGDLWDTTSERTSLVGDTK